MKLTDDVEAVDLALWLPRHKITIFSDFHIGIEEVMAKQGVLVPRFQVKDVIKRLEGIFARIKPDTVVINGDLKHEFGSILRQEWKGVLQLLDYLEGKCKKIVIVKGNHDVVLGSIARKKKVAVVVDYLAGDILISHGDKLPAADYKPLTIIIGHEHPAITIKEGAKREKYKCFLKGKWKGKTLIVQPSFNLLTEGTDIRRGEFLSPFLAKSVKDFEVFVVDDSKGEVLDFGKVGELE